MLVVSMVALSIMLLVLTAGQLVYVYLYQQFLSTPQTDSAADSNDAARSPVVAPAALVLCLRGVDPSLETCLNGITRQDYPDYQLHLVFDDHNDPAVEYVNQFFADRPQQPVLHFNLDPLQTCSLKCSGLKTVFCNLPAEIEYVALIDADAVPDERWLTDMLSPFSDPTVGATTGNRWFSPATCNVGSIYRKYWNAAAVVQVVLYNIGWGGSLAFRRIVTDDLTFQKAISEAFCEDTMMDEIMKQQGKKLHRIPHLIMNNTESTSLGDAFHWIARQTLTVRLHHKMWPLVLGHGILTGIMIFLTPVLIVTAVFKAALPVAGVLLGSFLVYQLSNFYLLFAIESCNHRSIESRLEVDHRSAQPRGSHFHLVLGALLNQLLYPFAILKAWRMRSVQWRGINYLIGRDRSLRMEKFIPYCEVIRTNDKLGTGSIQ